MKHLTITNIGKFFFWLSFILGNICLFGYIFTKNESFAEYGFMLLIYGSIINSIVIVGLLIFGMLYKEHFEDCKKFILIILLNIPIAFIYACIGISLL